MKKYKRPMKRFIVEYSLPYEHIVRVGITTETRKKAVSKAERLFNAGEIWQDTEKIPLLYDDFEEVELGNSLEFTVKQVMSEDVPWPEAGCCVKKLRRQTAADKAAQLLGAAYKNGKEYGAIKWEEIEAAYKAALKAVPKESL